VHFFSEKKFKFLGQFFFLREKVTRAVLEDKPSIITLLQSNQLMYWPLELINEKNISQIFIVFIKIKWISRSLFEFWLEEIDKGGPIRIQHRNPIEHVLCKQPVLIQDGSTRFFKDQLKLSQNLNPLQGSPP